MKTFFAIVLIVLAIITAWNTMEFWFYSQDVNALRKDVTALQQQVSELTGLKHPATPLPETTKPPPDVTTTPDTPPPLNPKPDVGNGPYYNDNWGWCRELQKADPSFKC